MEEPAQRIRRLARDLCSGEPLGEKGRSSSGVSAFTAVGNHSNKSECSELGFHLHQGASRRNGCFEKNGPQFIGRTRGGWNTKLHMVAASDRDGVIFSLSAGNCGDGPEGRSLLQKLGPTDHLVYLLMDRAYEGDGTRALAVELGYIPVVPPKSNRKNPWSYDIRLYKQRNQVERLFAASSAFAVFSLAMINLTLSFWPLSIWLLLLMRLCEHHLRVNTLICSKKHNSLTFLYKRGLGA